ncbi:MAG: type II toxin-antitoxin system RelE/ParE family toxin [Chthoniobacterales bacterium]|nr:type II toxin-antitoxin system RelE/ParE family toxin [Chthoniobacterales bacterium]
MPDYVISVARSAEKEIIALPSPVLERVRRIVDGLAIQPRPSGCKKLRNTRDRWRVRAGDYRVIYTIDDKSRKILIERVRHRRFVYR